MVGTLPFDSHRHSAASRYEVCMHNRIHHNRHGQSLEEVLEVAGAQVIKKGEIIRGKEEG
jgi:hypothetical protein